MFDRTSATASGSRFRAWKLIILAALLGATFALSGDTSRAEPDVDVSVTDTEITLSWDVRGSVVFYWHPANGGKTKVETVSGKSHTISALQPDTRYRFFFFQGLYGELYVTTLATAPDPPAPAAQDTTDATPCVPQLPSDAITIAEVTAWRDAHSHKADHVLRWNRVLAALGDNVQATPLPLADSRANENKFMRSRWSRVSRTLDAIENCGVVQDLQATPELSIAAGPDVLEGETLSFSLTASPVPTTPLTVELDIDTTGDFTVWDGTSTITLQTSGIYTLNLASSDDGVDEPNGTVTATISAGSGYTISSSAAAATVTIQDDDDPPLPQISISSAPHSVTEGDNIELTITSTPAPTSDLDVTLTVWATGDFGVSASQQTVTIPTSGSATVTLATTDDDVDEEDGFVTLEISAGSDYEPAVGTNIRGVAVQDDDLKFAQQGQAQDQQVQVTPTISLDQNSDCSSNDTDADGDGDVTTYDVDEDATLSFTLCSTGGNFAGPVKLRVVQGKSVVEGEDPDGTHTVRPHKPTSGPTVTIPEGSIPSGGRFKAVFDVEVAAATSNTSETLEYTIDEARYDQPDTTVQVIVLDGDGYTVGSQRLLTITIKDNDDPPAGFTSCLGNRVSGRDFTSWQAELFRNTLTPYKEDNDRWLRVLLALGEDKGDVPRSALLTPMTSAEIQNRGLMTRPRHDPNFQLPENIWWTRAYNTLKKLEECQAAEEAPQQGQAQDQQVQITPTISLDQNSDCSNNDADADGDSDATTYDVDEDATLSFTLCAAGANLPSKVKLQIIRGKHLDPERDPDGTHYIMAPNPVSGQTVANDSNLASGGYKLHQFITVTTTQNTSETLQYKLKRTLYDQPDTTVQVIVQSGDGYTVGSQKLLTITVQDNDETPTVFSSCFPDRVSGREFTSWRAAGYRAIPTQYSTDFARWSRVLLALGEPAASVPNSASLSPMTSAEIQTMGLMSRTTNLHNRPVAENTWWTQAYNTLKKLEECVAAQQAPKQDSAPDPQPQTAPDSQVQATPTITLDQNSDCSNNDADADGDSDVTTYDVDEDATLSFTLCATGANLPSTVKLRMTSGKEDVVGEDPDGTHWIPALRPTTKQQISRSAFVVWFRHKIAQDLTVTTNTSAMSETLEYKLNDTRYDQPDTTVTVVMLSGDGYTVGSQNRLTITIKDHDEPPAGYSSCFPNRRSGRHFTSWQAEDYRNLTTPFLGDNLLWSRVILALGEPRQDVPGVGQLSPMTSAEIEQLNLTNRSPYNPSHFVTIENSMWKEAYNTLKKLEECNAPSTENAQQSQDDQDAQSITIASQQDAEPDPTPAKRTHDSSKTLMENCEANLAGSNMFTLESFTKQKTLYDYAHAEEAFKRFQAAFGDSSVGAHIIPMTATEAKQLRDRFTPKVGPFKQYHKTHQVEWAQMRDAYNTLVMLNECAAMDFTTPIEPKVSISAHPNAHNTGVTFTVTAFPAPTETLKVPVSLVADSGAVLPQPIVSVDSSGIGTVTITTPDAVSSVTAALGTGDGYLLRDSSTNSATVNIVADSVALTGREPTISITEVSVNGVVDDDLEVTANTGDTVDIVVTADIGLTGIARVGHTADFRGIGKITTSFHRMDGTEITGQPVLGIFLSPEGKGFKRRGLGIWGMSVQKEFIARTVVDKTRPNGSDGTVTFNIEGGFGYLVDPNANEVIINVKASSP